MHRCTIVPPYLLQQVALNGSARQRRSALNALLLDDGIRLSRSLTAQARPLARRVGPRLYAALSGEGVDRAVHDAETTQQLPGKLVRSEGQAETPDVAVNEAYDGLGDTYQLFAEEYDRDSIDNQGMRLVGTVHFDEDYDNAFWDGRQMVFGDGDGELFNRFTIALDIIGHELTHGVTERESGLVYLRQPGALNESISDVFGSLTKQYVSQTTAEDADWLIGEGLFTDQVNGVALRSMKAPGTAYDDPTLGKDPQPATMDGYVFTSSDNGGVHINSGIPNHAFYLAAVEIGGYAWEKAGRIWYNALLSPQLTRRTRFRGFAALTSFTAAQLYGRFSPEAKAVRGAWRAVGLGPAQGARRQGRVQGRQVKSSSTSPWLPGAADAADADGGDDGEATEQAQPATRQRSGKRTASKSSSGRSRSTGRR